MSEWQTVIQTNILDIQFPDAENKHDSKNVGLFALQPPDAACNWTIFFFFFHFISFLMYISMEQFISFSNNAYSFILETVIYKW
jgi:hypothetical protein